MRNIAETIGEKNSIPAMHTLLLNKLDKLINKLIGNCNNMKTFQEEYKQIKEELFHRLQTY